MLNNSHIYINMSETEKCCKICKSNDLQVVISMGNQKININIPTIWKRQLKFLQLQLIYVCVIFVV